MRDSLLKPKVHIFVCTNDRLLQAGGGAAASLPLGPGCVNDGLPLFHALKELVLKQRLAQSVWVTQTSCIGLCPKNGAAVAIYPRGVLLSDVKADESERVLERALSEATDP